MIFSGIKIEMMKSTDGKDDMVLLPEKIGHLFNFEERETVTIQVGPFSYEVPYKVNPGGRNVLLGKNIVHKISLPLPSRLQLVVDPDAGLIRIGPVVAIFACTRPYSKGPKSRALFAARTLDMRQLLRHAKRLNMCAYILTPEGVDPDNDSVKGYVISGKRWKITQFPLPDVVYDRVQARDWEQRESTQHAKAFLRSNAHIKYFNEGFFDKWQLHQRIADHPLISPYVPDTKQLVDEHVLNEFLRQYRSIFIKPSEGSLGRGVTRIRRKGGVFEWKRGGRTQKIGRFDTLYQRVIRLKGKDNYIMQPDLRLATFRGAPFDIRILLQKDGRGRWMRTKTYARVAALGKITANLSRGGTGFGLGGVLGSRFGRSKRRIRHNINQAARSISKGLDDVFKGELGEIGLDLGISVNGRIWIIEINSKPFRKVLDAGPKLAAYRSFNRPMAYSRFLAGFS